MKLTQLALEGWRNWKPGAVKFSEGINVFWGSNGHGKTNLLEAIYFLAHLNSFRTFKTGELLNWDVDRCRVDGRMETLGAPKNMRVELTGSRRSLFVDGNQVSDSFDYFRGVCVVLFAPQHVELVKGPPTLRRRYMDRVAFRRSVEHLQLVRDYLKILRSRNIVLRENQPDLLDVYTARLAALGADLTIARLSAVEDINRRLGEVHRGLIGTDEEVEIKYRSAWRRHELNKKAELEDELLGQLAQNLAADQGRGYTVSGPHADDMEFLIDKKAARRFASQGQNRSVALALSVAEYRMLDELHGESPVFLMDDLSSELDESRRLALLEYLVRMEGQLFVTTTSAAALPEGMAAQKFEIVSGNVRA